jgi:hypothetical protein
LLSGKSDIHSVIVSMRGIRIESSIIRISKNISVKKNKVVKRGCERYDHFFSLHSVLALKDTMQLPEYAAALRRVAVDLDLMRSSKVKEGIQVLKYKSSQYEGVNRTKIDNEILKFVRKAFPDRSDVEYAYLNVIEYDYSGRLVSELRTLFHTNYSWEVPHLLAALSILAENDDVRLCSLLGLLARGQRECGARRRMAFSTVICAASSIISSDSNKDRNISASSDDGLSVAKMRIRNFAIDFIEDMKERAVRSIFVEPSIMVLTAMYDDVGAGDVDVHGLNTYLAMLESSIGISTSRLPMLDDEVKGIVDYRSALDNATLEKLHDPKMLGVSYRAIPGLQSRSLRLVSRPRQGLFIFNNTNRYLEVKTMADKASNPANSSVESRKRFAEYLETFCNYFSAEVFLPRLVSLVMADEGCLRDLQLVFDEELKKKGMLRMLRSKGKEDGEGKSEEAEVVEEDEVDDVRHWLWDIENADSPVFNIIGAQTLFAICGITKYPDGIAPFPSSISTSSSSSSSSSTESSSVANNTSSNAAVSAPITPSKVTLSSDQISLSAAGDICGGGTGREFLSNLLNTGTEAWNKWVHPHARSSWVKMEFRRSQHVVGYALCSANDCPNRDPVSWTVFGLDERGMTMTTPLHEVDMSNNVYDIFPRRWQWTEFTLGNGGAEVHGLMFKFHSVRRSGGK